MDHATEARLKAVEGEIQRLRDWKHDKVAQILQRLEADVGALSRDVLMVKGGMSEIRKDGRLTRSKFDQAKDVLLGLLLSIVAYLINKHGI